MGARRTAVTLLVLTAALGLAGCSEQQDEAAKPASKPSATPSATPSSKFGLPAGAKALVSERSGRGDRELPEFKPDKGVYAVYAHCSGKGKVTIVDHSNDKGRPKPVRCEGVPTVVQVYTDIEMQRLKVESTGTATWTVAVVSGEQEL